MSNLHFRRAAFLTLVFCAGFLTASCASYGPFRAGERVYRNVRFASPGGLELKMDLYVPHSARPAPVVIWIFGGSWKFGSKGYHVNLRDLTRSGIAVAPIQYRLSGTARYPAQIDDCRSAAEWLRTWGEKYGIDPLRIGAAGESAGGHLAALLGVIEGTPRIRAVCALYPPTDLVVLGRKYSSPTRLSNIDRLLGQRASENPRLAWEASPVSHVTPLAPPFLLFHGANDALVPLDQSVRLQRRLTLAGVEARLVVVPGKGHWFLLNPDQIKVTADFFLRHFAVAKRL